MERCWLVIVNFIVFITVCFPVVGSEFETARVKDTYLLLPTDIRDAIENHKPGRDFSLPTDNIIPGSRINVGFNTVSQISRIGLKLFDEAEIENDYKDAYRFLENSLLNYVLINQPQAIRKMAEDKKTTFFLNERLVTIETKNIIPFSNIINSKKFSLYFEDYQFLAVWTFLDEKRFAVKFPADINLLKGMDKGYLEDELLLQMKSFVLSGSVVFPKHKFEDVRKIKNGLYVQKGETFGTDSFNSDIYLEKKGGNGEYIPVYSGKFQPESFSNLFIVNLPSSITVNLTTMLYGNKKERIMLSLNEAQAFLSKNNETFFGLQNNENQTMEATIIYFNPIYRYIHMLTVEAATTALFGNSGKNINAKLYMFIPQSNFVKEVIYE